MNAEEILARLKDVEVKLGAQGQVKVDHDSLESFYTVRDNHRKGGKRVYTYYFNEELHKQNGLIVVPITDVHLGHKCCNVPAFKAYVQYILDTPNAVTILNGDLAETATKISVGMAMFEEEDHFPKQMAMLEEILKPLADAGKILGCGPGNHEERIANMIGINPMQMLSEKLGIPYFGYQGFFRIVVNGIIYKVVFHHGAGGGSSSGSRTNTGEKMNKVIANADLYVSGHTHGRQSHQDIIYLMDDESDSLIAHYRTYVVGGSFVEYFGAYPEMKALPPSITGLVRVELRPDKKDIRVTV